MRRIQLKQAAIALGLVAMVAPFASAELIKSVVYSDSPGIHSRQLSVDLYECSASAGKLVVYVHGGGWLRGDMRNVHGMPSFFSRRDICFASVNYPLTSPDERPVMDHQVDALRAFDQWLHRQSLDAGTLAYRDISIVAFSAGAHLVALTEKVHGWGWAVKNLVLLDSGSYDIEAKFLSGTPRYRSLIQQVLSLNRLPASAYSSVLRAYSPALISSEDRVPGVLKVTLVSGQSVQSSAAADLLAKSYRGVKGYRVNSINLPLRHRDFPRLIGVSAPLAEELLQIIGG